MAYLKSLNGFSAYLNAPVSNVTGDGTDYLVICNSTTINVGGNYNASTGVFTAPQSGLYQFNASVYFTGIGAGNVNIYISTNSQLHNIGFLGTGAATSNQLLQSGAIMLSMGAAQTASLHVIGNGITKVMGLNGGANPGAGTFFSAFLIG